jgi:DNA invertase Pin-like site-specific DNA recombinase
MSHTASTTSSMATHAIVYTRVNQTTRMSDESLRSLEDQQLAACERTAAERNIDVVDWYSDDLPDADYRKGLDRLLERLFNDDDDYVVIVDRIDALASNRPDQRELQDLIRAAGATLVVGSPE